MTTLLDEICNGDYSVSQLVKNSMQFGCLLHFLPNAHSLHVMDERELVELAEKVADVAAELQVYDPANADDSDEFMNKLSRLLAYQSQLDRLLGILVARRQLSK